MAGEWDVGVAAGVVGVILGPWLAALTRTLPGAGRLLTGMSWRGAGASRKRIALLTLLGGVVAGVLGAVFGAQPVLPAFLLLGLAGVVLAVVDFDCHRLPDRLVLPLYPASSVLLGAAGLAEGDLRRVATAGLVALSVLAGLLVAVLAFPTGFGLGDVKLAGLLSLHLGWFGVSTAILGLLAGLLLGSLAALGLLLTGRVTLRTPIPFGPALLAGWLLVAVAAAG